MYRAFRPALALVSLLLAPAAWGEEAAPPAELTPEELAGYQFEIDPEELEMEVSDLSLGQQFVLQKQRLEVSALMARRLGVLSMRGDLSDLDLIQRIVDEGIIAPEDLQSWQALGVVMGDLLARELELEWVQVEDSIGVSKALQFGKSQSFVFPLTMFSKRVQYGAEIDVHKLYRKVADDVERFRQLERLDGLNPPQP